jgi:hypothetical protein
MTTTDARRGALEAIERILNRGGDADDVLRQVVSVLSRLYPFVGIRFVEGGALVPGPSHGTAPAADATWPISFGGTEVAQLAVAGAADADCAFLGRVALVISPYCLVGWDTGGEAWDP